MAMLCVFFFAVVVLSISSEGVSVSQAPVYVADVDKTESYCFQFTWLGPKWDNTSALNTTCADLKAKPCMQPLVITHNKSPPNTTHMWNTYDIGQISCKLTRGEACTKWVNYYADEISNITYMCSKYTVEGVSKVNWEGCEMDYNSTYTTEVCACRSALGDMPCNAALSLLHVNNYLALFLVVVVLGVFV